MVAQVRKLLPAKQAAKAIMLDSKGTPIDSLTSQQQAWRQFLVGKLRSIDAPCPACVKAIGLTFTTKFIASLTFP